MINEKCRLYAVCPECGNSTWTTKKNGLFECMKCKEKIAPEEMVISRTECAFKPINAGFVRRVDENGRLVIPREIRQKYLIATGDPFELFEMDGVLCFVPFIESSWNIQVLNRVKKAIMEKECLEESERKNLVDKFSEIENVLRSIMNRAEEVDAEQ